MARKLDADTRKRRGFRRSFAGRRMQDVCRRPQLGDYRMYDVIFLSESFLREFFVANLKKHFSQFGEVLECNIKMDNTTKKSRGFGFVLYSSPDHVRKVASIIHYIAHKIANGDYIAPNVGPRTI
eukprot:m.94204 g.94204  ORF g.94204 m.94204 type:complete len:125 (+) comp36812_c0_seq2:138-512(+)